MKAINWLLNIYKTSLPIIAIVWLVGQLVGKFGSVCSTSWDNQDLTFCAGYEIWRSGFSWF